MRKSIIRQSQQHILSGDIKGFIAARPFISEALVPLHTAVIEFYEASKITAKYEQLVALLEMVKKEIDIVENNFRYFTATDKAYIQSVKGNFIKMLPEKIADAYIADIIKWCIAQGLLQQAVTMTAEKLPKYILHTSVIKSVAKTVVEDCEKGRQEWDSWANYLFKTYNPFKDIVNANLDDIDLTTKNLKKLIVANNYDYLKIMKAVQGKNIKLDMFLKKLVQLALAKPGLQFPIAVYRLNVNDYIRIIARAHFSQVSGDELLEALKRNYKNTTPTEFILKMIAIAKNNLLVDIFNMPVEKVRTAKDDEDVEAKIIYRKKVFARLIDENLLVVPNKERFLSIVEAHTSTVEYYRNRMNHGVIEFKGIEGNEKIKNTLLDILSNVEELARTNKIEETA